MNSQNKISDTRHTSRSARYSSREPRANARGRTHDTTNIKKGYKKLFVWQKADELTQDIYMVTKSYPKEEIFGITSQIRRAMVSIPTNIAEGMGGQNKKETKQFINIALGSLSEVEYLIELSLKLNLINEICYEKLEEKRNSIGAMLWRLYKSL